MTLLRDAGIDVTLLEDCQERRDAEEIIRPFATYIIHNRPHVTAKWAMTLDGKLATYTHDARWISKPDARSWVHDLRDRVDAILVGAGTVRADNPQLTVRLEEEQIRKPRLQPPLRVVLTSSGQLPAHLALLQPTLARGTCIIVGDTCSHETRQRLGSYGAEVLPIQLASSRQLDLQAVLQMLGQRGVMHVLIEGGARLLGSAFDQHCIDHVAAFVAPKLIGGSGAPSPMAGKGLALMDQAACLRNMRMRQFEADVLIEGDVSYEDYNDKRG
jgi:diaminohydroxyphosphoribosylaminopyrimidine deaminase/5-amino-6-(5-phosphoribosylamino)uracil reductase